MGHHHDHDHDHHHAHTTNKKVLFISFFLIAGFMLVELFGGIFTKSLALLSDAGHMFSDAFSLGLSLFALKLGEKGASLTKTFGYKRFEIIAALINGVSLLGIALFIIWEATHRFLEPVSIHSGGMMTIATIGLLINLLVAYILLKGDTGENLNIQSAFLHVLGDLLGSVGAIVAGALIYFFGWVYADPLVSVIVALLILMSGWRVTKKSFHILMEGNPANVNVQEIERELLNLNEVISVHDLHVWAITSSFPAFSCHLVVKEGSNRDEVLKEAKKILSQTFSIDHVTIQIESEAFDIECDHCNQ